MENGNAAICPDRCGTLPSCAPLATGHVPFQQKGSQRYNQRDALSNGTLFPGLNLPFHLSEEPPVRNSDAVHLPHTSSR